jgi:hypothetical protein
METSVKDREDLIGVQAHRFWNKYGQSKIKKKARTYSLLCEMIPEYLYLSDVSLSTGVTP